MTVEQSVINLTKLGLFFEESIKNNEQILLLAKSKNGWFSASQIKLAFLSWANALTKFNIEKWLSKYPKLNADNIPKRVGLIMAGNIPMVGLHDLLCVLISGNIAVVKMSSDDTVLMRFIIKELENIDPSLSKRIELVEKLTSIDAVIATGNNNSSRYFDAYFGKYPHIIRKNRTSVAVLTGDETSEQLSLLAKDIFSYYGLGCRNVTKLYLPKDYDFTLFFESIISFSWVLENNKYTHNYDYHKTLFLLNNEQLLDNEFVLVKENTRLKSPIGVLHYENYSTSIDEVYKRLIRNDEVQCIIGAHRTNFGDAQSPQLWDYADKVDTINFLLN